MWHKIEDMEVKDRGSEATESVMKKKEIGMVDKQIPVLMIEGGKGELNTTPVANVPLTDELSQVHMKRRMPIVVGGGQTGVSRSIQV